jgi:DnaJ-class molecular chaperone
MVLESQLFAIETEETCPECGGRGIVEVDCGECSGTGRTRRWGENEEDDCPNCSGTGKIDEPCRSC